mmetsp:Transcript_16857/g.14338  ORF Transcript_16857/g.14338 Transcript_16857/m.14338 type:complete len:93 (-) Transcript_16857:70-348(-)
MYYAIPQYGLGEPITQYSWIQAVGFVLLVYGQLVYDQALRLPCGLDTKQRVSPSLVPLSAPLVASPAERKVSPRATIGSSYRSPHTERLLLP